MASIRQRRELDLSHFPRGTVTEFTTLVCLACIFDIFTEQLGLAPRTAFSEIKKHTPAATRRGPTSTAPKSALFARIAARPNAGTRSSIPWSSRAVRQLTRPAVLS